MVGINVVYKCPYCNNIIYTDLGVIHYYKHKDIDKDIIIAHHCDKPFITVPIHEDNDYMNRYSFPRHKLYILGCVETALENVYDESADEDTIINNIIDFLRTSDKYDSIRSFIERDINDIKVVCQLKLAHLVPDFVSLPLTDEIKSNLKSAGTMCW